MEEGVAATSGWMVTFAALLENSALGVAMRESSFLYPLVNIAHLIGLVLIVGGIGLLDLRMLGLASQVPPASLYPLLTRFAVFGVVLQIASGILLFASDARALLDNGAFVLKMLLLAAALINAAIFRLLWTARVETWDARPPFLGLVQCAFSLFAWLSIGTLGRLIAYV
jgi:hypothetical protein